MNSRRLLIVPAVLFMLIVVLGMVMLMRGDDGPGGAPTAHSATPAASATDGDVQTTPAALVTAMTDDLARSRTFHVQFSGSDADGALAFDLHADGAGGLIGTYTRDGAVGDVRLSQGALYMHGHDAIAAYTHLDVPGGGTAWVHLRGDLGILGILAAPRALQACVDAHSRSLQSTGTRVVAGTTGIVFAPVFQQHGQVGTLPWVFVVARDGAPHLLAWQLLQSAKVEPTTCSGSGAHSRTAGIFTFSEFGAHVAPVGIPSGAVEMTPATSDGDPGPP